MRRGIPFGSRSGPAPARARLLLLGVLAQLAVSPALAGPPSPALPAEGATLSGAEVRGAPDPGPPSRRGERRVGFLLGLGRGTRLLATGGEHDLALAVLTAGRVVGEALAPRRWWGGHAEVVGELFVGHQLDPSEEGLLGLSLLYRHGFTRSGPWQPFVNGGAGAGYTEIRDGDLSTDLQFNLVAGGGVHRRFGRGGALTLEYRWLHLSNADIELPNNGVDTHTVLVGMSRFF